MASRAWADNELDVLHRTDLTLRQMADHLGRSYNAVVTKRLRLGLQPLPVDNAESRKTQCPQGHLYDDENTLVSPLGHRRCRACSNARRRAYKRCKRCESGVSHEFKHGTPGGHNYHGCRCAACKGWARARSTSIEDYWKNRERNLEQKRAQRERNLDAHKERERRKRNSPEAKATARRRRERENRVPVTRSGRWSDAEKAIVLLDDVTVLEKAYMLGRAPHTVQAMRNWLADSDRILEYNRKYREDHRERLTAWRREKYQQQPRGQRTHCKRGHPFDEENTYRHAGQRYCKACRLIHHPLKGPRQKPTHCPQGHPYAGDNVRVYGNGYRRCMACDRDKHRSDFCKNGHKFTDKNTRICTGPTGREVRRCVTCDKSRNKEQMAS